ncbi:MULTISPECIES: MFS transporter [unclassified Streptomyces]|uniref:MFS transporter n=1 Tax=unclassified Streptomyces TaxID=2593676 RepID=UPI0006B02298|nr:MULTISPECIES: MFS transporter [unclassified Streptomyces]KOX24951.1 MFS transporter [Streptomyces sp. NRRL F-6491]KOX47428.1 MFS transporter [Streptomyces sp. NRRL F-6492]
MSSTARSEVPVVPATPGVPDAPGASGAPSSPGPALAAAMLGFALITLDTSVVNVALPAVGADLGTGMTGLQWVVDSYTLALAALLLSSGALADRVGASRAYGAGVVVFTLASAACGLAPGLPALLAARTVQGAAAAVMLPASLALVREAYGDPGRRARAVSLWAAGGTVAVALGPVVGGALTTAWSWRGVFFVNLPLGLAALLPLARVARSVRRPAPLDLPGQLTATAALGALTFAAVEGGARGWWALGTAVVSFAAFLVIEARRHDPVVPLGLFRNTTVAVTVAAGAANSVAFYGMLFVFGLFFQQVLGLSALGAGLMFLPMTGLLAGVNLLSAKAAARYGARLPIVAGQVVAVAGLLGLLAVDAGTPRAAQALLLVPLALGAGFSLPPLIATMMEAVPAERAGTAAGLLNAVRQTAGGLAIAVFGSLADRSVASALRTSLLISAGFLTLTALASLRLPRRRAREVARTGGGPSPRHS